MDQIADIVGTICNFVNDTVLLLVFLHTDIVGTLFNFVNDTVLVLLQVILRNEIGLSNRNLVRE